MEHYLQEIVKKISFANLPAEWQNFDLKSFSQKKRLYDFQKEALENSLKGLHLFYSENHKDYQTRKNNFFQKYRNNNYDENFDYTLNQKGSKKKSKENKTTKYLLEYSEEYSVSGDKISFASFINRMSFWMATGSGKTLVIVKLIHLLGELIRKGEIPKNDILFLAHREDLLQQFKEHIAEFNRDNFETKILLKSLKEYESVKHENALPYSKKEITIFYYRSDLISDEHKQNIVNFKNYDNFGKWYILLDEAHKGDKEESKRQIFYSILSRNGFLFNFSATFTDARDYASCVFDFNLAKFIGAGYGKHIYVSKQKVTAFKEQDNFSEIEKQKIVLKTLLLQTYSYKHFKKIRKTNGSLYHRPLLLTLVNSVNTKKSDLDKIIKEPDLKLFFAELEKIANNQIKPNLLEEAKTELLAEFSDNNKYLFENTKIEIDSNILSKISYKKILQAVFNANNFGKIEILKVPKNKKEIAFKLQTSEKPFALIKIGDISGWLKDTVADYQIIESLENESIFKKINQDDSDINILMGSRSFYEGWDSNRPNLILFVNIGMAKDSKKFVLQSVGRGLRIEPLKNKRKRLQNLIAAEEAEQELFDKIKQNILALESLFVFGTNAENLKNIIEKLQEEQQKPEHNLGDLFAINEKIKNRLLLVPVYQKSNKILAESSTVLKYSVSKKDLTQTQKLFEHLGDKIVLLKNECEIKVLKKVSESMQNQSKYYNFDETRNIDKPDLHLKSILDYFSIQNQEVDGFKKLEAEIVHFKEIKFKDGNKIEELKEKLEIIKNQKLNKSSAAKELELEELFKTGKRKDYDEQLTLFEKFESAKTFELNNQKIKIKYLANHYYHPLIVAEQEKVDYLNHIIDVPSEIKFIENLEEYLQKDNSVFKNYDWWMFSKLDETLDSIHIPYYNPKTNSISHFFPDFIFWMQKEKNYTILFLDPKGTEHTDVIRKIDGYKNLFEEKIENKNQAKKYLSHGFTIKTQLFFKTRDTTLAPEEYRKYWLDDFDRLAGKINEA